MKKILAFVAALAVSCSPAFAQSVSCLRQPDPLLLKELCTYRTASGAAVTTRKLTWTVQNPAVLKVTGDANMRNVTIVPLTEGMSFLTVSTVVSGRTYSYQFPAIIVAPKSILVATPTQVDSIQVYFRQNGVRLPPNPTVEVGAVVNGCAELYDSTKHLLVDTCTTPGMPPFQSVLAAHGGGPNRIWVLKGP